MSEAPNRICVDFDDEGGYLTACNSEPICPPSDHVTARSEYIHVAIVEGLVEALQCYIDTPCVGPLPPSILFALAAYEQQAMKEQP
jgi:hypothetical protein